MRCVIRMRKGTPQINIPGERSKGCLIEVDVNLDEMIDSLFKVRMPIHDLSN
jgi:hypothetical protein